MVNFSERLRQRLSHFHKAFLVFERRRAAFLQNSTDEGAQMALIQAFEIVLELSWKSLKDYLEAEGYTEIASPKSVLRTAFQAGAVEDGDGWMEALRIRNITSHVYVEEVMEEALVFISQRFYILLQNIIPLFQKLGGT